MKKFLYLLTVLAVSFPLVLSAQSGPSSPVSDVLDLYGNTGNYSYLSAEGEDIDSFFADMADEDAPAFNTEYIDRIVLLQISQDDMDENELEIFFDQIDTAVESGNYILVEETDEYIQYIAMDDSSGGEESVREIVEIIFGEDEMLVLSLIGNIPVNELL